MELIFAPDAKTEVDIEKAVQDFTTKVPTIEAKNSSPIIVFQDGKSSAYYIRCGLAAADAARLIDLDARLIPESADSLRANRELLVDHVTFKRMKDDATGGREFSDIIVEYCDSYTPERPLKVWGGQHRSKAIQEVHAGSGVSRVHGFRVYFQLTKEQRTEVALISNTNIAISDDLFDRQLEETFVGPDLRKWCEQVGLLDVGVDFPSQGSRAERITTKLARSFLVNFYRGRERGKELGGKELDKNIYEPYLCDSGTTLDAAYETLVNSEGAGPWKVKALIDAGTSFANLNRAQTQAVIHGANIKNRKGFRLKALTASVLTAWAYVAGLLQVDPTRLGVHYQIPPPAKGSADPLNAAEMSIYKHEEDPATYRGLGTRTVPKDRQRMAQVFLARSKDATSVMDKKLLNQAVSQVRGLKALQKGYGA